RHALAHLAFICFKIGDYNNIHFIPPSQYCFGCSGSFVIKEQCIWGRIFFLATKKLNFYRSCGEWIDFGQCAIFLTVNRESSNPQTEYALPFMSVFKLLLID
ncbi:mCG145586, partial [Mus musculus]